MKRSTVCVSLAVGLFAPGCTRDLPIGPPDAGPGFAVSAVELAAPTVFVLIDEDGIDNGSPPNFFSDVDVNDHVAAIGLRDELPYFAAHVGETIDLPTGKVGDEGWFSLLSVPDAWASAGPTADGVRNLVAAGPGLGSPDGAGDREALLDKILDVTALRAPQLELLAGRVVCALVWDSDISVNYDPPTGNLKGANLGLVAFEVLSATPGTRQSSLPTLRVRIRDAGDDCAGPLTPLRVGSITGVPDDIVLEACAELTLELEIRDLNGDPVPEGDVSFSSSDPSVAEVGADGRVTAACDAVEEGEVTITIRVGDRVVTIRCRIFLPPRPKRAAAGDGYTCVLDESGTAFCFGNNDNGQSGNGGGGGGVGGGSGAGFGFGGLGGGGSHACGLTADGRAFCWGANGDGQLGDGTDVDRFGPVPVDTDLRFRRIWAGARHTCAITLDRRLYCWGRNDRAQLGDGTKTGRRRPVRAGEGLLFAWIALCHHYGCGVTVTGEVYCWGGNDEGVLGNGTTTESLVPVRISVPSGLRFKAITAGHNHACGITLDGDIYCWGANPFGQLGTGGGGTLTPVAVAAPPGIRFVAIAGGGQHTCALASDGVAYCWGWNGSGQLGDGTTSDRSVPQLVFGGFRFDDIVAGTLHTVALVGGVPYAWGANADGQLGNGGTADSPAPVPVVLTGTLMGKVRSPQRGRLSGVTVTAAGVSATTDAQGLYVLAGLPPGAAGVTVSAPGCTDPAAQSVTVTAGVAVAVDFTVTCPPANPFAFVTPGFSFTCALASSGIVYCWGDNAFGQVGDRGFTDQAAPVAVAGQLEFTAIESGGAHTCGLTPAGKAWCWGRNNFGQLGDGTLVNRPAPSPVATGLTFLTLVTGDRHTCGLTSGHAVVCWGSNEFGQAGGAIGGTSFTTPRAVPGAPAFSALAAGLGHTCGLAGGTLHCWGLNGFGQLGNGGTANSASPIAVSAATPFNAVTGGSFHTCAIANDDQAYCWGRNTAGQLGDGSLVDRHTPVPVIGGFLWQSVLAGGNLGHTCGVTTTGELRCWGRNVVGQLGDGTTTDRSTPTLVTGDFSFVQVQTAGANHVCATTLGGGVWCWGNNADGQLGNGTLTPRSTPGAVSPAALLSPLAPGSVTGRVSSPQRGNLNNVVVRVGAPHDTTRNGGLYAVAPVVEGPATVTVHNLPAGCTDPGPQLVTVSPGGAATADFTVQCVVVASVTLAPTAPFIQVGTIVTPVATPRDGAGNPVVSAVTWTNTSPSAVSVSAAGQWTALAPGVAVITATSGGVSATATVTVEAGCPAAPVAGCLLTTQNAGLEPYLRSVGSPAATTIEFINSSAATIRVYWLDFAGARQLFATLLPGQSYVQGTFTTHPWVVTDDAGAALGIYWNPSTLGARVVHGPPVVGLLAPTPGTPGFQLHEVWGAAANDVWAVGFSGSLLHFDGAIWKVVSTPSSSPMKGVWGSGPNDVFAVGWNGTIIHWNGSSWTLQPSGVTVFLEGVWGTSPTNVFVVGTGGTILHYDGTSWAPMASGTTQDLFGVWGSGTNVFAVGAGGTVRRYDGVSWTGTSVSFNALISVWGSSATDMFAVGQNGAIHHFDGATWSAQASGTTELLLAVGGTSPTNVFAMGFNGTLRRYNGTSWSARTPGTSANLEGIWFAAPDDAFIVTSAGSVLRGSP